MVILAETLRCVLGLAAYGADPTDDHLVTKEEEAHARGPAGAKPPAAAPPSAPSSAEAPSRRASHVGQRVSAML